MSLPLTADPPPLVSDAQGVVRVRCTRVPLDTVVAAFREGQTPEEIQEQYPSLYYLHHRPEVEEYLQTKSRCRDEVRREIEGRFDPTGIRDRLLARIRASVGSEGGPG